MKIHFRAHARQSRAVALSIVASLALGGCFSGSDDTTAESRVKPVWANPGNSGGNKPATDTTTGDTTTTTTDTTTTSGSTSTTTDTTTAGTPSTTDTTTASGTTDTTTIAPTTDTASTGTTTTTTPQPVVATATLVWTAPTVNVDGSALIDLGGYHVYKGTSATNLARVASIGVTQTSYTVGDLTTGTYYFAVSAYNRTGTESALSNIASKTVTN